jgi:diadenosine tetraphosphate (Ap4A) HIT family hydrolase
MSDDSCWFCADPRTEPPPGGWLVDDELWRAGHAPASYSCAGTMVLESRRHVLDASGFTDEEAASYGAVLGRLVGAMRAGTGCDRVYQWSTMDKYPHFHVWLLPWWRTSGSRGPAYLAETVFHGAPEHDVDLTAARIRDALLAV